MNYARSLQQATEPLTAAPTAQGGRRSGGGSVALSDGTSRRVRRVVRCTGDGFARVESTITRKGTRPLSSANSFVDGSGNTIYPRDGYYYVRQKDGTLIKGEGTYAEGTPCPECVSVTTLDGIGIPLDPLRQFEFDPAKPLEIEFEAAEMPEPGSLWWPEGDNGFGSFMAQDSHGCETFEPIYRDAEVPQINDDFLRVWVASGLGGDHTDVILPRLTEAEWLRVRDYMNASSNQTSHVVLEREWPQTVRFTKNRNEAGPCNDQFWPGATRYVFCVGGMNDPNQQGGWGGATVYGSVIVEIQYVIPNLWLPTFPDGPIYVAGQHHFYNVNDGVVEPCDPWTLLEDIPPNKQPTTTTPPSSGTPTLPPSMSPTDPPTTQTPTTPEAPAGPTDTPQRPIVLPECIRVVNNQFVYCPPTTCAVGQQAPTGPAFYGGMDYTAAGMGPQFEYQVTQNGPLVALSADVARYYGATHVQLPAVQRRALNTNDAWSDVPTQDRVRIPRYVIERVLQAIPTVGDAGVDAERNAWSALLATAPLQDDVGSVGALGGAIGSASVAIPMDAVSTSPNTVCYEARLALEPYPCWFANIGGRWVELDHCCPRKDDACCDETKAELGIIRTQLARVLELVSRKDAGEATPVVDLTSIHRELAEIKTKISAPVTQYDDTSLLLRITELERVMRDNGSRTYDDTAIRSSIAELKTLVTERCEKCVPGRNYDTKLDEIQAGIELILTKPSVTDYDYSEDFDEIRRLIQGMPSDTGGNAYDYTPQLTEIRDLVRSLKTTTGPDYTSNFARLEQLIQAIKASCPPSPDYTARFNAIESTLATILGTTSRNYDSQITQMLTILRDLQGRTPSTYDERFDALEGMIRNIRVAESRDYDARFNRMEELIASLQRTCPDYSERFTAIEEMIRDLKLPSSDGAQSTSGETRCGGTTVNCGGTSDARLDVVLDRLLDLKQSSGSSAAVDGALREISRQIESVRTDSIRNTDTRFDDVRRLLLQVQDELRSRPTLGGATPTVPQSPAPDPRIDEVLRILTAVQNTSGSMSAAVIAVQQELATTQQNYTDLQAVFSQYLQDLKASIREQGASASSYDELKRAEDEYAFQRSMYETTIADLRSRLAAAQNAMPSITINTSASQQQSQQNTSQQQPTGTPARRETITAESGGSTPAGQPVMVEEHRRLIYQYPQAGPSYDDHCSEC